MENISPALLEWFYKNRRILPFREDPPPYHVWLSEIMLQQTRVSAALPYYERFLAALPDIPALAACEEEKLHKLWEGLGYYSRVRNMQAAAGQIVKRGGFPQTAEELKKLRENTMRNTKFLQKRMLRAFPTMKQESGSHALSDLKELLRKDKDGKK